MILLMSSPDGRLSATYRLKHHYWPLIKSRQTFTLTLTGIAGYLCQLPAPVDWPRLAGLVGSLFITISGCTVLNMVFDRDIDCKMARTSSRPLVVEPGNARTATYLGGALIAMGILWAFTLSELYGILALAGAGLDVLVYTLWLKRRSAWSIVWGGLSGGIPILAGSSLAVGRIDAAGLLLALAVVCWIPSHNLTLGMLYPADYLTAGVPTFFNVYGQAITLAAMGLSSLVTIALMAAAFIWLNLFPGVLAILAASSLGLVGLAIYAWKRSSLRVVGALYKYSSFYMLASMVLLSLAVLK